VDEGLRPLLQELQGQARVHTPGQVEYSQHVAMVKACSFGIAPSLLENYSMALLEAVYCGVPMLAFASGGNPDIIQPGKNGYLARMGDAHDLVEKAKTLLHPRTLAKLKQSTLDYSHKTLSPHRAVDGYIEAIEWLSPA
jgi:glycosyltransferase involved in cell wall biosynthesis